MSKITDVSREEKKMLRSVFPAFLYPIHIRNPGKTGSIRFLLLYDSFYQPVL